MMVVYTQPTNLKCLRKEVNKMGECRFCGDGCPDNCDYCSDCANGIEETKEMMHPDETDEEFWSHEDED